MEHAEALALLAIDARFVLIHLHAIRQVANFRTWVRND